MGDDQVDERQNCNFGELFLILIKLFLFEITFTV